MQQGQLDFNQFNLNLVFLEPYDMFCIQIEPILLAASSQSRADVVTIFISSALALTGLQWLALKPKPPKTVELLAEPVIYVHNSLNPNIVAELLR